MRCIRLDSFDMSWHAKPEILSFGFSFISTSKSSISRMYPWERNMRGFKYKLTIFSLIWNKDIVSLYEHCTLKVWNVLLYLTNHSTHYIQHISRDWYVAKRNTLPLFFFLTVKSNPRNCLYASNVLGHYALKGNCCLYYLPWQPLLCRNGHISIWHTSVGGGQCGPKRGILKPRDQRESHP